MPLAPDMIGAHMNVITRDEMKRLIAQGHRQRLAVPPPVLNPVTGFCPEREEVFLRSIEQRGPACSCMPQPYGVRGVAY